MTYLERPCCIDSRLGLLVVREILIHDVERLLIDLQVVVLLEIVYGNHTPSLFHVESVLVDTSWPLRLLVHLANLQDVVETIERHLDDLVVHHLKEIAQGFDTTLRDEVTNLRRLLETTGCSVRDRPASLLLGLEVGVLENIDEGRDNVGVDDRLNLLRRARSNVRDRPAGLLPDTVLGRRQKRKECRE